MADIWASVLGLESVSVEDNMFELGADSIHLFQITARANQAGIKVTPRHLLEHRTIAAVTAALAAPKETGAKPASPTIRRASREAHRVTQPTG